MKVKKLISVCLVLLVLLLSLSVGLNALAKTNSEISLNTMYIDSINGADDKIWYTFTPQASGEYAFVSYSQSNEAYLFTKSNKLYKQIKYAGPSDPDYMSNFREFTQGGKTYKHYATTFYLQCYLLKGVTYYFATGYANENQTSGTVNVVLYNLSIDENDVKIQSISVECPTSLSAYTDGTWDRDAGGDYFFYYNFSKISENMIINVLYKDGTVATAYGSDESFDGYNISFRHTQSVNHWFAQNTAEYVANTLTISLGPVSCDYDVPIETSAMYGIKGKVVDYVTGEPIENARVMINSSEVARTDGNGNYAFVYTSGTFSATIKTNSSIDYGFTLIVDTKNTSNNDKSNEPVRLINCDYVKDGIINGKDYALARKNGYAFHPSITNFTKNNY